MSNTTSDARGNGQQKRRRSRGGRNRNRNRQGQGQGNSNQGNRQPHGGDLQPRRSGGRTRAAKPKPLTWWQKLLKAIGLYKEPAPKRRSETGQPVKHNTRVAKTGGETPRDRDRDQDRDRGRGRDRDRDRDNPDKRRERAEARAKDVDSRRLYLGNLSYEAGESDLEELFRGVGSVRRVEIVYNRRTHRSKGYGFIEMLDTDEAKKAVEVLHDQFFMGRKLVVSAAKSDGPADTDDREQDDDTEPAAAKAAPAPAPVATEAPVTEEAPTIEETPASEETRVAEEAPAAEEPEEKKDAPQG